MHLRKATATDLDQILSLFENTVRNINSSDYSQEQIDVWAAAKNREIWTQKIIDQCFFVAIMENTIVGFSSIDKEGYLDFMYVHHEYQRKGIALALLNQIESTARKIRVSRICVSVSITAQPFFLKHGYTRYSDESKSISGIAFTNALMEKEIL